MFPLFHKTFLIITYYSTYVLKQDPEILAYMG